MSAIPEIKTLPTIRRRRRRILKSAIIYASAVFIAFFVLFPLYWIVVNSLRSQQELATVGLSWAPTVPTLENYTNITGAIFPFSLLLRNSLIAAFGTVIVSVIAGVCAAYAVSRFMFRGKELFMVAILLIYLIPHVLLLVPLFIILRDIGLLNTWWGLILAHSTNALPFAIWMLVGYFNELPRELEEAAWMDGAGRLQALAYVILPLALPGLIAVGLFAFLVSWNEFLYASAIVQKNAAKTLPLGLFNATETNSRIYWGEVTAAGVLTVLPVGAFFLVFQSYLIKGLTQGALKG